MSQGHGVCEFDATNLIKYFENKLTYLFDLYVNIGWAFVQSNTYRFQFSFEKCSLLI